MYLACLVAQPCPTLLTPWTAARQAPLSMGFPRQEHWSRLPRPPPGELPDSGTAPASPELAGRVFTPGPPGKPTRYALKYDVTCRWLDPRVECCVHL